MNCISVTKLPKLTEIFSNYVSNFPNFRKFSVRRKYFGVPEHLGNVSRKHLVIMQGPHDRLQNVKPSFQSVRFHIASIALREVRGAAMVCLKTVSKQAKFIISAIFVSKNLVVSKIMISFAARNKTNDTQAGDIPIGVSLYLIGEAYNT